MSPERRASDENLDEVFETDPSRLSDPDHLAMVRWRASSLITYGISRGDHVFVEEVIGWIRKYTLEKNRRRESYLFEEELSLIQQHRIEYPLPWTPKQVETEPPPRKFESLNAIDHIITPWLAEKGYTIGFATGVFDLLLAGHVLFLQWCKSQCDYLIVGVDSNELVAQQKGAPRPLNDFTVRLATLCALPEINCCYRVEAYFDGQTPYAFLPTTLHTRYNPNPKPCMGDILDRDFVNHIAPHIIYFVTEGDPTAGFKAEESAAWGVNLVVLPKLTGLSSTAIADHFNVRQSTYMPNRFTIPPWWIRPLFSL